MKSEVLLRLQNVLLLQQHEVCVYVCEKKCVCLYNTNADGRSWCHQLLSRFLFFILPVSIEWLRTLYFILTSLKMRSNLFR